MYDSGLIVHAIGAFDATVDLFPNPQMQTIGMVQFNSSYEQMTVEEVMFMSYRIHPSLLCVMNAHLVKLAHFRVLNFISHNAFAP